MKLFILFYNPLAGDAGFRNQLDTVFESLRRHGCYAVSFRTASKDDTEQGILLARRVGADGVIVAGGDGTLHEVINALLRQELSLPVGIIPCGTCNDFAASLGIENNLETCCRRIAEGHLQAIDIGRVNGRYFLNVASAGLFTTVAHKVETPLKNTMGKLAYYLKGLGQLPSFNAYRMSITADGNRFEDEVLLFLVMNSGIVGSFPKLAPQAALDDGKLDLLIVSKCALHELMGLMLRIVTGNLTGQKHITYLQASHIHIACDMVVESDLDGELGPNLPLDISVLPGAIQIFIDKKK